MNAADLTHSHVCPSCGITWSHTELHCPAIALDDRIKEADWPSDPMFCDRAECIPSVEDVA